MTDFLDHVAASLPAPQRDVSSSDEQVPAAPVCALCGVLMGRHSKVHFAKVSDARPCPQGFKP